MQPSSRSFASGFACLLLHVSLSQSACVPVSASQFLPGFLPPSVSACLSLSLSVCVHYFLCPVCLLPGTTITLQCISAHYLLCFFLGTTSTLRSISAHYFLCHLCFFLGTTNTLQSICDHYFLCSMCLLPGTTHTLRSVRDHYFVCPLCHLLGTTIKTFTTNLYYRKYNENQYHVYISLTLTSAQLVFYASSHSLACQAACVSYMAAPLLFYPAYLPAPKPAFPYLLTLFHASAYVLACPCLPLLGAFTCKILHKCLCLLARLCFFA
jgi:hypothetical protein